MTLNWAGWGEQERAVALPEAIGELLAQGLGVSGPGAPAPAIDTFPLPDPRLPPAEIEALAAIAPTDTGRRARLTHLRGKSTSDLLRLRALDGAGTPDVVLEPESHEQVLALLARCEESRIAVVPFGGGTSVVGGLEPDAGGLQGVAALDLGRMRRLLDLDEESRLAELEPGLRGPEAEALLGEHGLTIGHFPQSFLFASLGGFAAARSSGQASAGYGRFDELVHGLRLATPRGTLELGRSPRSAAGPDLRQLVLGSEGTLGVITALRVAVRPRPHRRHYAGWRFASFAEGTRAVRSLAQDGPRPDVLRLSDEAETAINLARPGELGQGSGGSLMICGWELASEIARDAAQARLRELGGEPVPGAGEAWAHGRYDGPYLRDALLDAGALVETLETACFWSGLPRLYAAVSEALHASLGAAVVLCHISHVYATGASLYFTVAAAQGDDPVGRWQAAKRAANESIGRAGGTITHHHGVGRDHRDGLAAEIGPVGVAILRAVKRELDPHGILNPGVLIP